MIIKTVNLPIRFLNKIHETTLGCWEWIASKDGHGYGFYWFNGAMRRAPRFAYENLIKTIPDGSEIDHLCKNTSCVNPDHLEPVTHQENVRRGNSGWFLREKQLAKTHCPYGHLYDKKNTYFRPAGGRECKICQGRWNKEYRERIKERKKCPACPYKELEEK